MASQSTIESFVRHACLSMYQFATWKADSSEVHNRSRVVTADLCLHTQREACRARKWDKPLSSGLPLPLQQVGWPHAVVEASASEWWSAFGERLPVLYRGTMEVLRFDTESDSGAEAASAAARQITACSRAGLRTPVPTWHRTSRGDAVGGAHLAGSWRGSGGEAGRGLL